MIQNQTVLAIIPARGGSKGLPGKNIKPLAGKPLIAWSILAAQQSQYIDRVIVSSDDEKIIDVAREYDCEAPFVRPAELATDTASSLGTVLHAIEQVPGYDVVVLLQPTSPLRTHMDIDCAIETMIDNHANSCASVTAPDKSPYWMYSIKDNRLHPLLENADNASQRQQQPETYVLNGAIYVVKTGELKKTGRFITDGTVGHIMEKSRSIDIDDDIDFKLAELLLQNVGGLLT